MIVLAQIYMLICILFLAGKDASSYLLKDKVNEDDLTHKRIRRWHRDGVAMNILFVVPIVVLAPELYMIILYTLLLRLAVFDLAFNYWAKLDYRFLGSTAWADKLFIKFFGNYGALKKSLFFLGLLVILNVVFAIF